MNELQEMKDINATLENCWNNTDSWSIKSSLKKTMYDLQDKIRIEEKRSNTRLETKNIKGVIVEIPEAIRKNYRTNENRFDLQYVNEVLYLIDKRSERDRDGSYNWYHYAWIKMSDSYVLLNVRTLGGDKYGKRVYITADYYNHVADEYRYSKRHISSKSKIYEKYSEHILKELSPYD